MNSGYPPRVVIVGAGHGGTNAAAFLRQQRFDGEIVLLGEESAAPYHRPPLSKKYVVGVGAEIDLKSFDFYRDQEIQLRLGCRATSVDPIEREVVLEGDERIGYSSIILATGARPRKLAIPGAELGGIGTLRTVVEAGRIREFLSAGRELVIIGGGYIGLEVAAACRTKGIAVTVVEREDRLLARVASAQLSRFLTEHHRSHGTRIMTSANVTGFHGGSDGMVSAVSLADGTEIDCGVVLIGVGAEPSDELAKAAGIACDSGVIVDDQARTSHEAVYAVGDMTRRPLDGRPGLFRMESIPSAVEQAGQAVAAILKRPRPKPEVPWFWSDQFDLKLKMAGLVQDSDTSVARFAGGKGAFFHLRNGSVVAVESVNASPEFMAGKKFIERRSTVDPNALADSSLPLRKVEV